MTKITPKKIVQNTPKTHKMTKITQKKITKIPLKPKNDPKTLKMSKIPPKPKKLQKYLRNLKKKKNAKITSKPKN